MARQPQTRGACVYCGKDFTRGGMTKHLPTCPARADVLAEAEHGKRKAQRLFHLTVVARGTNRFWLQLEMNGAATLDDLDMYLRAIWLECCGHLSSFRIGAYHYTQLFDDGFTQPGDRSMEVRADKVLQPGMSIPYEYDFGSTTELVVTVQDMREGKPTTDHPIVLLARNQMPEMGCAICGKPATMICVECSWDETGEYLFCDEHAEEHKHKEYLVGVWNSPRTGVCGYDGPAESPW